MERASRVSVRRSVLSGVLVGVGTAAFLDEAVFHQLLHWHHFYDRSTPTIGLVSDGIFHAFGWFCIVGGLFLFADVRRAGELGIVRWWSGVMLGLGGFQLYDGTVQHKLLGLHQIRYGVNLWPYDVAWNAAAVAALIIGLAVYRRARCDAPAADEAGRSDLTA
jgi:uncharacterized membrane protein